MKSCGAAGTSRTDPAGPGWDSANRNAIHLCASVDSPLVGLVGRLTREAGRQEPVGFAEGSDTCADGSSGHYVAAHISKPTPTTYGGSGTAQAASAAMPLLAGTDGSWLIDGDGVHGFQMLPEAGIPGLHLHPDPLLLSAQPDSKMSDGAQHSTGRRCLLAEWMSVDGVAEQRHATRFDP